MKKQIVDFSGYDCLVVKNHYTHNNQISLQLVADDSLRNQKNDTFPGEPIATATSCFDYNVDADQTFIKDFSENKGVLKSLIDAGIVEDLGMQVPTGHAHLNLVKVLI